MPVVVVTPPHRYCPRCKRDAPTTADGVYFSHNLAPWVRALCPASGKTIDEAREIAQGWGR